jgi:hypothetical protein
MSRRWTLVVVVAILSIPSMAGAQISCVDPPPGLQSWWTGDGNAADVFGAWNGTLVGDATHADGIVDGAFSFDGSGGWVEVADAAAGDFGSDAFTVAFWLQSSTDGSSTYLVGKSHPDGGQGWDIRLHDRRIQLEGVNGWDPQYNLQTDQVITASQWHHIAVASDGHNVTLYVDGATSPAWTIQRQTITTAANPLRFGLTTNYGGTGLNGRIDEIMFFNRALNSTEIASISDDWVTAVCRPCTSLPTDGLAWWSADIDATDDISGFDGTLNGDATYVAGKVGNAFSFGGAGHVSLPKVPEWNFGTSDFSIVAWFASSSIGYRNIIRYHDGGGSSGWWGVRSNPDGRLQFLLADASGSPNNQTLTSTEVVADGAWHHVVAVRDASGGQLRLYLDGAEAATPIADNGYEVAGDSDTNAAIGAGLWGDSDSRWEPWIGEIDELMLFNRALTEAEVRALANAASSGVCTSCNEVSGDVVSWWRGEDDGTDSAGDNDGTEVNSAAYAAGLVGQAFSLEGSNDYVEVPHDESLSFGATDPMTIDLWAKRTGGSAVGQHLIGKRPGCGSTANYQIVLDRLVNNGVCFAGDSGSSISVCSTGGLDDLPLDEWTHIAFAFDGATGRLYLDGEEVASAAGTLGLPNTTTVRIGTSGDCGAPGIDYDFYGLIDEVEIHDRALSLGEIQSVYNAGAYGKCETVIVPEIFSDGFEDGDTSAWSADTNPP